MYIYMYTYRLYMLVMYGTHMQMYIHTFVSELYIYSYILIACHISFIHLIIIESPRPFNLCILTITYKKQGHNSYRS